jgi:hypothetical protein
VACDSLTRVHEPKWKSWQEPTKKASEEAAQGKSISDQIDDLGGDEHILKLGFPKDEIHYLQLPDRLAFLNGDIDLAEAKERARRP